MRYPWLLTSVFRMHNPLVILATPSRDTACDPRRQGPAASCWLGHWGLCRGGYHRAHCCHGDYPGCGLLFLSPVQQGGSSASDGVYESACPVVTCVDSDKESCCVCPLCAALTTRRIIYIICIISSHHRATILCPFVVTVLSKVFFIYIDLFMSLLAHILLQTKTVMLWLRVVLTGWSVWFMSLISVWTILSSVRLLSYILV